MKNLLLAICFSAIFTLTGCATTKTLLPINGSKADGTVTLAYEYGAFEDPQVDWNLAKTTARARCAAWGYKNAEAFGGAQNHCTAYSEYGCVNTQVNVIYQCSK